MKLINILKAIYIIALSILIGASLYMANSTHDINTFGIFIILSVICFFEAVKILRLYD